MLVVEHSPAARRNVGKVTIGVTTTFSIQDGHFFLFAFLLGGNHGNVFSGGVKGRTNLGFLVVRAQRVVGFEFRHEVVDLNPKGLLAGLDFAIQKDNVRLCRVKK